MNLNIVVNGFLCGLLLTSPVYAQTPPAVHTATTGSATVGAGTQSEAARLSQQDVEKILSQAETAGAKIASGLRSTDDEKRACRFHIFVVDRNGNIQGRRSMADAWTGSIDIALGKARTAAFFSSDENALSSRQLGELSHPSGPGGEGGAGPLWGIGDTNRPGDDDLGVKKNSLVTFPGGLPLYKDGRLVGGIGVSGDGVDQDEAAAFAGAEGFMPGDKVGRPSPLEPKQVDKVSNE